MGIWGLATLEHVLTRSWIGFSTARFRLAIGQSGNSLSAIKAVAGCGYLISLHIVQLWYRKLQQLIFKNRIDE